MPARTSTLALAATLVGTALTGLALTMPVSAAATATTACTVDYSVNDWGTGFTATVAINNKGTVALNGWTLTYSYAGNQTLSGSGWNGTWSQSGKNVTVSNLSWNATIPPAGSVSAGANFGYSGANAAPTAFAVNGAACTGVAPSPSPTTAPPTTAPPTTAPPTTPPPTTAPPTTAPPTTTPPSGPAPALHVSGNKLVDAAGNTVTLHGVDRSGAEFMCIQGKGFFDGPVDAASIAAIKTWKVNAVRVPLNEDCWLGLANVNSAYSGAAYQSAVKGFVDALRAAGITPILDLHWTHGQYTGNSAGCSDVNATCQKPMPGANGVPFWTSVANTFKSDPAVVFDLFNEPYPDRSESSATQAWLCWRDGGSACPGIAYPVSGMQSMVNAVRSTGATNVLMLGGLAYSNDLSQWLTYKPTDPTGNLAASWHVYNFNSCSSSSCWNSTIAPVAAQVPLVTGEMGENDCAHGFIDQVMSWLDSHQLSYLGWTWNTWDCSSGPSLITAYDGTPTAFGLGLRTHLQSLG